MLAISEVASWQLCVRTRQRVVRSREGGRECADQRACTYTLRVKNEKRTRTRTRTKTKTENEERPPSALALASSSSSHLFRFRFGIDVALRRPASQLAFASCFPFPFPFPFPVPVPVRCMSPTCRALLPPRLPSRLRLHLRLHLPLSSFIFPPSFARVHVGHPPIFVQALTTHLFVPISTRVAAPPRPALGAGTNTQKIK